MAEEVLFEATVVPHRSLSGRGRAVLIGAIGVICVVNVIIFAGLRAWPVCGFSGVELLLAALMLRLHGRAARASEVVLLTPASLCVIRTDSRGRRAERVLPPMWLQVELEERPGRVPALWVGRGGAREEIARTLGEVEKRDLAAALGEALRRWRNPRFDNPQLAE
jgi:uncharacterized membrane protein